VQTAFQRKQLDKLWREPALSQSWEHEAHSLAGRRVDKVSDAGEGVSHSLWARAAGTPPRRLHCEDVIILLCPPPWVINVDGHPDMPARSPNSSGPASSAGAVVVEPHLTWTSHRAGPPVHQKADHGESRLPFSGGAWRTIEGYEAMHAIRKGQVRWVAKGDPLAHRQFIHTIFGVAAWSRW